jgi:UDP-N-acetylglucosamine 2-epimerase (hydrolysing)
MAPVVHALKKRDAFRTTVCVTAQHRDLLDQVLSVFDLVPDIDLNLMQPDQTLAALTSRCIETFSAVLEERSPSAVLVHGDTTTTLCCALSAFYRQIPIGHVEAGLRSGNVWSPWPEEMNRRTVDSFAEFLWAPTKGAAKHLENEGLHPSKVQVTGNTVVDALIMAQRKLDANPALQQEINGMEVFSDLYSRTILVTGHRRESFDGGLAGICDALKTVAERPDVSILWTLHPNPNVLSTIRDRLGRSSNIYLHPPMDYLRFLSSLRRCSIIVTDSGGIQEEAPYLKKPVLVTRSVTERPEIIEAGGGKLVGTDQAQIVSSLRALLDSEEEYEAWTASPNIYGDGTAAEQIAERLCDWIGARS